MKYVILIVTMLLTSCGQAREAIDRGFGKVVNIPTFTNPDTPQHYLDLFEEYKQYITPTQHINYMTHITPQPGEKRPLATCFIGFRGNNELIVYIEFYYEPGTYSEQIERKIAFHEFAHCGNNAEHSDTVEIMNPTIPVYDEFTEQEWQAQVAELIEYINKQRG